MIDSHCHLADRQFDADRDDVIKRAKEAGVSPLIVISDTVKESKDALTLAQKYEHIFCTVGVHPHHASSWNSESRGALKDLSSEKSVVGLGEMGLDYHYDRSPRDMQQSTFEEQLALAKELALPAVIHTREAIEDTWSIVQNILPKKLVLHCCCEQFEDVERFLDQGYLLSFTGMCTYPNAETIRETMKQCPLDQLMIETDAPYLSPQKYRGKRNEPAFVREVAECVAGVKGVPLEEVDRVTTENAKGFFGV